MIIKSLLIYLVLFIVFSIDSIGVIDFVKGALKRAASLPSDSIFWIESVACPESSLSKSAVTQVDSVGSETTSVKAGSF